MGRWLDEARGSAAREFGARHYRVFSIAALVGVVVRVLLPLAVLVGAGIGVWWLVAAVSDGLSEWWLWLVLAIGGLGVLALAIWAIGALISRYRYGSGFADWDFKGDSLSLPGAL